MNRFVVTGRVVEECRIWVEADNEEEALAEAQKSISTFGMEIFSTHREVQYNVTQED